jgi:hypothetical protein
LLAAAEAANAKEIPEEPENLLIEAVEPVAGPAVTAPFSASLWQDPDIRWLTGIHAADGLDYFVQEPYEDLLWWLQLPKLLDLAAETTPDTAEFLAIAASIRQALSDAETAKYRLNTATAAPSEIVIDTPIETLADTQLEPILPADPPLPEP